jgi:hypothetical protein
MSDNSDVPETKKILIIGDWVVDEHWVIGVHRSPTSSRTGQAHYRALHYSASSVESLCGAGRTASVLDQTRFEGRAYCKIIGIGAWHEDDTDVLTAMLDPRCTQKTPYQLTRTTCQKGGGRLFNLGKLTKLRANDQTECLYGTTRMIRIYQHEGAKFDLLQRIDWELQLSQPQVSDLMEVGKIQEYQDETVMVRGEKDLKESGLEAWLQAHQPVSAIVIKDMCKGVVSEPLIRWLAERLKGVPWFVSTKAWCPKWFDSLPKTDVRLILIPQVAAEWAVRNGAVHRWITRSGDPSDKALHAMERLGQRFNKAFIVALPDGLKVLARDCSTNEDHRIGMVQSETGPRPLVVGLPMASVFFPALIANVMKTEELKESIRFDRLLKDALRFTHKWMSLEIGRVENPKRWSPSVAQVLELDSKDEEPSLNSWKPFDGVWKPFSWDQAINHWQQAFSDFGIIERQETVQELINPGIENQGFKCLELWRAMTEVDGYVCCMKSKRTILQKVVNELKSFDAKTRDSKSCLLVASPGSGKTFLVRRLADTLKLRFLGFNITQMISKHDLLDCFDTIVTNQAQNRDEPLLVFLDEINANLDGQHVYDAFLAPLEDGVYVRAGKTFHIDPCVWVFAGTEHPSQGGNHRVDKSEKASDFVSRLTLGPLDLKISGKLTEAEENEAKLEEVYLGVSLLRSLFPDVHRVSTKVLRAFHTLPVSVEARELKHFIKAFADIQYGEVRAKNIHKERFKEFCGNITNWNGIPELEKDMIEIKG